MRQLSASSHKLTTDFFAASGRARSERFLDGESWRGLCTNLARRGGSDMRYARHLVPLVVAFGLADAQEPAPNENQNQQAPPMCCQEVPQPPPTQQRIQRRHERWRDVFSPDQGSLSVGGGG